MKIDIKTEHERCVDIHGTYNEQRVSFYYSDNKYALSLRNADSSDVYYYKKGSVLDKNRYSI